MQRQKVVDVYEDKNNWYLTLECGNRISRIKRPFFPFYGTFFGQATYIKPKFCWCNCKKCEIKKDE